MESSTGQFTSFQNSEINSSKLGIKNIKVGSRNQEHVSSDRSKNREKGGWFKMKLQRSELTWWSL